MTFYFYISVRFLQAYSHGRAENAEPEWPPSPLRAFQALVAASAGRWNERRRISHALPALRWLQAQPPPEILAPVGVASNTKCQFYVPDNTADLLVPAWQRGETTKQVKRTEKVVRPAHLAGEAVYYLYPLSADHRPRLDILTAAARSITHLGWGIDMVAGDAGIMSGERLATLEGRRWRPAPTGRTPLRVPVEGTVDDLMRKHSDFLSRITDSGFRPVPPLRVFDVVGYRREDEPLGRPFRVFELRCADGSRFRYPPSKLIHIAGMVRHLAIETLKKDPPRRVDEDWVETYVAGHRRPEQHGEELTTSDTHRQLSYLPLPSIGHVHTDPGVRRVMIVAPVGDDEWLDHVARHLAGQRLKPLRGDEFGDGDPPLLVPVRHDNIAPLYTQPANVWSSVTPVILPGHDDHKPDKTRKLIEKALAQSGVEQPCEFEWSAFSRFPKSLSAHKYDKDGKPTGYLRPDYLNSRTAVHITLRFHNEVRVPGPLVIGAGRHVGLGLMAPPLQGRD